MKKHAAFIAVLLLALGVGSYAVAGGGKRHLKSDDMTGYQENPDIMSTGFGSFDSRIDESAQLIHYTLTYGMLESPAFMAHIHFAKRGVNGGISVWLCGGAPPASDKPPCPPAGGTVTGTIDPLDVIGPDNQGIEATKFDELVKAMRDGRTYANVHSNRFPGGEIRGQINDRNQRDDDD